MTILVVDNKIAELNHTVKCLQAIYPDALLIPFNDAMEAVRYGFNHAIDAVYTEITMWHLTGFDVARLIRKQQLDARIYFISDTDKHLSLAIKNGGDGYFLKPINTQTLLFKSRIMSPARSTKNNI